MRLVFATSETTRPVPRAPSVAAVSLLFGVYPRSAVLVSWVLLVSLDNRQPLVISGADMILRLLLFWALFLPLVHGSKASRGAASSDEWRIECSPASVALLIQVVLIYGFGGIHKLLDPAWTQLTPPGNRYYVFRACLRDGSNVDLNTGNDLDWDHPRRRSRNNHWWKYQLHMSQPAQRRLRPAYARYLIGQWNRVQPIERHVASLELVKIDASRSSGEPISQLPREILWSGGRVSASRCRI